MLSPSRIFTLTWKILIVRMAIDENLHISIGGMFGDDVSNVLCLTPFTNTCSMKGHCKDTKVESSRERKMENSKFHSEKFFFSSLSRKNRLPTPILGKLSKQ
jgi:hypothetical protein